MEETVWIYFGVIMAIVALGVVVSTFVTYNRESKEQFVFQGVEQLGKQVSIVCDAPQGTMLSTEITMTAGSELFTYSDRLCASAKGKVRCIPSACDLEEEVILNLSEAFFDAHDYRCTVLHNATLRISCQG